VIAYFGDGASSQGDVNEAFIFAASFNAPVVFFCQNNQWAISEPLEKQTRIPLYRARPGSASRASGSTATTSSPCLAVTRKAPRWTRAAGQGPSLIEAFTYRMGAHTTSDDPTRYRLASDLEAWKLKDPIERVRSTCGASSWPTRRSSTRSRPRPRRSPCGCARAAARCPTPSRTDDVRHVYAEPHQQVEPGRSSPRLARATSSGRTADGGGGRMTTRR
jgi:2-oxoisovalerate dehydrogenase E1 component alpha subunit